METKDVEKIVQDKLKLVKQSMEAGFDKVGVSIRHLQETQDKDLAEIRKQVTLTNNRTGKLEEKCLKLNEAHLRRRDMCPFKEDIEEGVKRVVSEEVLQTYQEKQQKKIRNLMLIITGVFTITSLIVAVLQFVL